MRRRRGAPPADGGDFAAFARREGADFEARLHRGNVDHSIGDLYLESARSDQSIAKAGEVPPNAVAIATDVLPRYFAALEPAPRVAARPVPRATVTLVRWPYT